MDKIRKACMVIRPLRDEIKLSQEEFAFRAELNRRYVSNLETGKSNPSWESIYKMARALHMKPSELVKYMEEHLDEEDQYWLEKDPALKE